MFQSRAPHVPLTLAWVLALGMSWQPQAQAQVGMQAKPSQPRAVPSVALHSPAFASSSTEQWPGSRFGVPSSPSGCFLPPPEAVDRSTQPDPTSQTLPQNLVALMPSTNFGQTSQAHPTLLWYLPRTTARYARFSLYTADAKLKPEELLYRSRFRLQGQNGILGFSMPPELGIPPLQTDRAYVWQLQVYCDSDQSTRDPHVLELTFNPHGSASSAQPRPSTPAYSEVQGILWRVDPPPNPIARMQSSSLDPVNLYRETSLWWDAVQHALTASCDPGSAQPPSLRTSGDPDTRIPSSWHALLDEVHLGILSQAPILVPCP
ncbi:MAG: DUF928 domain-containing protein [Prochlorothrix sp.]|nr:DUF928 domain-containing protein [Prochlorothrix sp.]